MKKVTYLFVMIVGMTLASVNVNAQDAKSTSDPVKKEGKACCKSGEKMADGKTCSKEATTAKAGACTKTKGETTASETKVSKTVN